MALFKRTDIEKIRRYTYKAKEEDEIELKVGDLIIIHQVFDDGWV